MLVADIVNSEKNARDKIIRVVLGLVWPCGEHKACELVSL